MEDLGDDKLVSNQTIDGLIAEFEEVEYVYHVNYGRKYITGALGGTVGFFLAIYVLYPLVRIIYVTTNSPANAREIL